MEKTQFKQAWQELMKLAQSSKAEGSVTKISRHQYPIPNSGILLEDPSTKKMK
jgi:hypothetical protein